MTDRLITNDFRTPPGWSSGHLQTIRSRVLRQPVDLAGAGKQRTLLVDLADGTGDQLSVHLHTSRLHPVAPNAGGLVTLIHGLGGSAESDYVRATTLGLLRAGFNVARLDLRGAGRSVETSTLLYHAGRTDDIRAALAALAREPEASDNRTGEPRIALMGFSLGGNMTLKLMGEPHADLPLFAAVSVSAPLDLTVGSQFLSKRALGTYEKFLLAGLKRQALQPGPGEQLRVSESEREAIQRARTLAAFDDALTAPRNGWRDSAEYYQVNSSALFLSFIDAPTLVIHALDDPMIPASPYRSIDWETLAEAGFVQRRITPRGGHVGFHERDTSQPWYIGQAVRFLSRA
ncbi:MAG: alpha/beta fold hydrolase [Candidatus Nanopelagicales bacterium]